MSILIWPSEINWVLHNKEKPNDNEDQKKRVIKIHPVSGGWGDPLNSSDCGHGCKEIVFFHRKKKGKYTEKKKKQTKRNQTDVK